MAVAAAVSRRSGWLMVCATMAPIAPATSKARMKATSVTALISRSAITNTTSGTTATSMNATINRVRTLQWVIRLIVPAAPCALYRQATSGA